MAKLYDKTSLKMLVRSLNSVDQLRQALEQIGSQREKLINFPLEANNGKTVVHLAASMGQSDCLELLLRSGGEFIVSEIR